MHQLLITIATTDADLVSGWLFELGVVGFEERNAGDTTHFVVYSEDPEELESTRAACDELARSANLQQEPGFELSTMDSGYQRAWLEHLKPEWLTDTIVIQPVSAPPPPPGVRAIVYQPELAFGTGGHATTRLAAGAVASYCEQHPGLCVLDVGTGNGVLSFVALVSGASAAVGVDVDPAAVQAAAVNAGLNGFGARAVFLNTPLEKVVNRFELIVANIDALTVSSMAPALAQLAPSRLIVTGFLDEQRGEVENSYLAQGARVVGSQSLEDWCLLSLAADLTKQRRL